MIESRAILPQSKEQTILHYTLYSHEYISLPLVNYAKSTYGWTTLQFSSIAYLKRFGKLSMSELARYLFVSKQQATQLVTSLVKHGLATRTHSEANRRVIYVMATDTAIEQLSEAETIFIEHVKEELDSCREEDKQLIYNAMKTMISFAKNHGEDLLQITDPHT